PFASRSSKEVSTFIYPPPCERVANCDPDRKRQSQPAATGFGMQDHRSALRKPPRDYRTVKSGKTFQYHSQVFDNRDRIVQERKASSRCRHLARSRTISRKSVNQVLNRERHQT